jgi:GNAT superfamily N-acetyltransferase
MTNFNHIFSKVSIKPFKLKQFTKKYKLDEYDLIDLNNVHNAILLEDLFVKENHRGKGHGTEFINSLKQDNKPIIIYSLFEAIEFWEKYGFKNVTDNEYIYIWGL